MVGTHLGVIVASWIAYWGYRREFLSGYGAAAAWAVGSAVWIGGGLGLAAPLLFFFVASSLITRRATRRSAENRMGQIRASTAHRNSRPGRAKLSTARGSNESRVTRNAWQVAANGTVAAICALVGGISGDPRWLVAGLCVIAAMAGDTWSSEMGRALAKRPFDLRTFRPVEAGLSGAISWAGSLAGLAGAVLTTAVGVLFFGPGTANPGQLLLMVAGWAFVAVWVDSLLGAFVQRRYFCHHCLAVTDEPLHCNRPTVRTAGIAWVDNNAVNAMTTVFAAMLGFLL